MINYARISFRSLAYNESALTLFLFLFWEKKNMSAFIIHGAHIARKEPIENGDEPMEKQIGSQGEIMRE